MFKTCINCSQLKDITDFYKKKSGQLLARCKTCSKAQVLQYYSENRDKILNNKKVYFQQNKETIVKRMGSYKKQRQLQDLNFKIANNLRSRLTHAIKKNYKTGSAVSDLGCSISDFKNYISSQFKPGMSWDNYGQWHIDHIKPLSSFDLTNSTHLKEACNYKNLQPLWAEENLKKGGAVSN